MEVPFSNNRLVVALPGATVQLCCPTQNGFRSVPICYTWSKVNGAHSFPSHAILLLKNLCMEDSGQYVVEVDVEGRVIFKETFCLSVEPDAANWSQVILKNVGGIPDSDLVRYLQEKGDVRHIHRYNNKATVCMRIRCLHWLKLGNPYQIGSFSTKVHIHLHRAKSLSKNGIHYPVRKILSSKVKSAKDLCLKDRMYTLLWEDGSITEEPYEYVAENCQELLNDYVKSSRIQFKGRRTPYANARTCRRKRT